jgi:hypothetical protein
MGKDRENLSSLSCVTVENPSFSGKKRGILPSSPVAQTNVAKSLPAK